ncbi:MAG: cation transporting ATPase C-terminal domain-containing protein, partial [Chloroflexota bacterium]
ATTMTVAAIVACQLGNAYASRTARVSVFSIGLFSNRLLNLGVLAAVGILLLLVYTPFLQPIFNTAPLGAREWAFLLVWPPLILAADELRKWAIRRGERREGVSP